MNDRTEPRVLVVSHNALRPDGNMGRTLSGLVQSWDRAAVAQLYFRQEIPDLSAAARFYRVTDFEALWGGGGPADGTSQEADRWRQAVYARGRRRIPLQDWARELLWLPGQWHTGKLKRWLAEFDPQVILFAGGGYCFAYRVARRLGRELGIPVVPYFCDDYYFADRGDPSLLYRLHRRALRRCIGRIAREAPVCVAISQRLAEEYRREFDRPFHLCMTGASRQAEKPTRERRREGAPFRLCYVGRLGLGRADVLAELGRQIVRAGLPMTVEVWTAETDSAILAPLEQGAGVRLMGALPGDRVWDTLAAADGVLHVESGDPAMTARTRCSVSTKIPDLLTCGACPVVCGPAELASVEHVERHGAALVLHGPEEAEKLTRLLDASCRREITARARELAARCHDGAKNSRGLNRLLAGVCAGEEVCP